jgi:hypothetical protein
MVRALYGLQNIAVLFFITLKNACSSINSRMDSDLEAFSHNPPDVASRLCPLEQTHYQMSESMVPLVLNRITILIGISVG